MRIFIFLFSTIIHAAITPPNYDFTLNSLETFLPGKSIEEVKKANPKFKTIEDNGDAKTYLFIIKKPNYKLDIYTQVKKDVITDLYVRLPQHFVHDILLKDLQTKWKKQDRFVRKDGSALYTWMNRDNFNILYHGTCSITCFPMFLEIVSNEKSVRPLYNKLNEALPAF